VSVFAAKPITLPDGAEVLLRSPDESEAQRLLDYLDAVRRESDGIMFDPADDLPSIEEERQWVRGNLESDGGVHVAAVIENQIAALAGIYPMKFVRQRHSAGIGISIRKRWCGRGLGTVLMRELVGWACEHRGLEQLTLCVFDTNPCAQAVYRKVGFREDGRLPRRAKIHGQYIDLVEMSLWLNEAEALS
jgi:RimJ/RimL family protein N-acetyltransferase